MADRLTFKFIRTGNVTSSGEVSVDVTNPADDKEIAEKLRNRDFATLIFKSHEYNNEKWHYEPTEEKLLN